MGFLSSPTQTTQILCTINKIKINIIKINVRYMDPKNRFFFKYLSITKSMAESDTIDVSYLMTPNIL